MTNILIKICGISSPDIAAQTARAGADYIGIVFHPHSPRYIDKNIAKEVVHAAKENGAEPVAVFVNQSAEEMQQICEDTDINVIQLHGDIARSQQHLLPIHYQRIVASVVLSDKKSLNTQAEVYSSYCKERDFLLFDSATPGKGQSFDWQQFKYSYSFRWFLAGGLTAQNVQQAIQLLNPTGVDVSSAVEIEPGKKDIKRIIEFINAVKCL